MGFSHIKLGIYHIHDVAAPDDLTWMGNTYSIIVCSRAATDSLGGGSKNITLGAGSQTLLVA